MENKMSDSIKIRGIIEHIHPPQTLVISVVQDVVIKTNEPYPQYLTITFGEGILEGFMSKDKVDVAFYICGRRWLSPKGITEYFNSLRGIKIEHL